MKLAEGRAKIEEKLKSAATADLTTGDAGASGSAGRESKATNTGSGSAKAKGSRKASNTSDTVDDVTKRLIDLLKKLETETAIAAVAAIVRRFGDANWMPAAERKKAA